MNEVVVPTSAPEAPPQTTLRRRVTVAASVVMGAAVPVACFRPIVGVSDTFATPEHAWRILLMPSVLLAAAAVLFAVLIPSARPGRLPPALAGGGALLILAAVVSTAASQDPGASAIIAVLAISAPIILVVALLHADVSPPALGLAFLVTSTLFLLRADVVFLRHWGLPTASTLRTAKLSDQPYDFHYYTLGNADHTAGFLLMTLVLAAFWAGQRGGLSRGLRALLCVIAAISLLTLFLTYARFAIVTAIIALGILIVVIPVKTWSRFVLLSIIGGSTAIIAAVDWHYISTLLDTGAGSSGFVRTTSIENGLAALSSKPLTGVGLGQYGPATGIEPAHSAIVQAGAEMGVLGLLAIVLLTAALVGLAIRLIRRYGWLGLPSAAALAAANYAVHASLAASSSEGLYSGFNPIWGLSAALLVVIALRARPNAGHALDGVGTGSVSRGAAETDAPSPRVPAGVEGPVSRLAGTPLRGD